MCLVPYRWASIAAVHLSTKVFTAPAFAYMYAQQAKMMVRALTTHMHDAHHPKW